MTGWDQFWAAYPRHVAKAEARKAWAKLDPSPELVTAILDALAWQREQWTDPKYTPYPASYLRGERWEDEPPVRQTRERQYGDWRFECKALHGGRCENIHFHTARMADDKERAS